MSNDHKADDHNVSGYRMDEYAEAVADEALRELLAVHDELPNPIRKLGLTGMQGDLRAGFVVVQGGAREYRELELAGPDTLIPQHIDLADDDDVLAAFYRRHGIDPDEALDDDTAPSWGDAFALPAVVLIHELIEAANRVGLRLSQAGVAVSDDCRFYAGDHDSYWGRWDGLDRMAREAVGALPEAQRQDMAVMCYVSPERRRWLTG